jgi:hypothetical protein
VDATSGRGEITGGVAGGEITNQIIFMHRDDILNLFVVTNMPLPAEALPPTAARRPRGRDIF